MRFKSYIPFFIFIAIIGVLAWHTQVNKNITRQVFNLNQVDIILGDKKILQSNDDYMLIYVFSPKCGRCQESFPKIKQLRKLGKKIIGVVIDENKEDVKEMECWRDGIFDAVGRITRNDAYFFDIKELPDILLIKNHGDIILRNKVEISQEFDIVNLKRIVADAAAN